MFCTYLYLLEKSLKAVKRLDYDSDPKLDTDLE